MKIEYFSRIQIFIKSGDQQALKDKKIEIELKDSLNSIYKRIIQTDQDGLVEFTFEPNSCSSDCKSNQLSETPETITVKVYITFEKNTIIKKIDLKK